LFSTGGIAGIPCRMESAEQNDSLECSAENAPQQLVLLGRDFDNIADGESYTCGARIQDVLRSIHDLLSTRLQTALQKLPGRLKENGVLENLAPFVLEVSRAHSTMLDLSQVCFILNVMSCCIFHDPLLYCVARLLLALLCIASEQ
jgi:hypothetical protein